VDKNVVRSRIEEVGIIPAVRLSSADDAMFAAEAVYRGGIPIVEVTLTVPGAIEVISHLVQNAPEMIVGAGSVLDVDTARLCLQAGVKFLTSDGIDLDVVKFAAKENVVVFPGALTPTGAEGYVPGRSIDCCGRSELEDRLRFHSGRGHSARRRQGVGLPRGYSLAAGGASSYFGESVPGFCERCAQPKISTLTTGKLPGIRHLMPPHHVVAARAKIKELWVCPETSVHSAFSLGW